MLSELVKTMSEYDRQQEADILASKRRQDVNLKEKEKLAREKQALDMLTWRLQREILSKRRETDSRLEKCKAKSSECQVISNKLLEATVERAGLLMENQSVAKEIQKSFFRIKQIDGVLIKTKGELEEAKTNWGKLKMTLRWYSRNTKSLMEENGQLLEERRRAKDDFDFHGMKLEQLSEKKARTLQDLAGYDDLLKISEKDLNDIIQEGLVLKSTEERLLQQISKATAEKRELEKAYVDKLASLEISGKLVKNINEMIAKMVGEHQKQELNMYKVENSVARLMVELEEMKGLLRDRQHELDLAQRQTRDSEDALRGPRERLGYLGSRELKLRNSIAEKKRALHKLEDALKNKTYLDSPLFTKKRNLEQSIKQIQKSIEEKESVWIQMQEGCLVAAKKRNQQLEKINCLKKQISTMETSLERAAQKMRKEQTELRELRGELKSVGHRLEQLQESGSRQGEAKVRAEEVNRESEERFISLLKDLEKSVMKTQEDIWELEEGSEEQRSAVERLQGELLEWNKKYNLAVQMRREIQAEKGKGGEVAAMRQEIHRMEVRYANLRKAEEKMITDLELCLTRRDSMVDSAEARERRAKACGANTSRVFAWRKMEETKTKLRTMIRAVRELREEKESCLSRRRELSEELEFWRSSVERLSGSLQLLEQQIQEGQIHRHRTLEMTVMRQRKCKLLEELRLGRYRVSATEDSLAAQEESLAGIRNALLHILDELKTDFPSLRLQLTQIENTISYSLDPDED